MLSVSRMSEQPVAYARPERYMERLVRVHGNCPSLKAGVGISIAFEYFERNIPLSQGLGQAKTAYTSSSNQYVHSDDA